MDTNFPGCVTLVEVGPQDGFQREPVVVPTERKRSVIERLIEAGLKWIQVTSFVHPVKVPQMADAEQLIAQLPQRSGVVFTALVLNAHGLERALTCGVKAVEISLSASDTHSKRNTGMPHQEALSQTLAMVDRAVSKGLCVRASIQCAFGCVDEGAVSLDRIAGTVAQFVQRGAEAVSLADTTGMGSPPLIEKTLERVLPLIDDRPLALHLHDTRGLGLVNLMTALKYGVCWFDTSLGGMGGCPFVRGAAGNIATEDTVYFLRTLGIRTGVDLHQVAAVSRELAAFFEKPFPGKLYKETARLSRHTEPR